MQIVKAMNELSAELHDSKHQDVMSDVLVEEPLAGYAGMM